MSREVIEEDFRMPEFVGKDPKDYEFRGDGKIVRKDRWEKGIHKLNEILGYQREFEIDDLLEKVRVIKNEAAEAKLMKSTHEM